MSNGSTKSREADESELRLEVVPDAVETAWRNFLEVALGDRTSSVEPATVQQTVRRLARIFDPPVGRQP
jgi:hypothetical protein